MKFEPKIYIKGLILVAVPLLLAVVFGVSLLSLQNVYRQALDEEEHAKLIIYHANEMWLWCTDAVTSKFAGRVDPRAMRLFGSELGHVDEEYNILLNLVKNDDAQTWRLQKVRWYVDQLIKATDQFERSRAQPVDSNIAGLVGKLATFQRVQAGFRRLRQNIMDFRAPILQQSHTLRDKALQLHSTIQQMTAVMIVGSLVLAAGLYIYFMKGINGGIQLLLTNTKRLETSENLMPMLNTTDELGDLDRSFHHMADVLRERSTELEKLNTELSRSNNDLQQFAYVASHDLQEPLRAVSSYLDILNRRHGSTLDKEALSFVAKAEDGARRMQLLIRDLLAYARVDARGIELAAVDANQIAKLALSNLKVAIEESGGKVTVENLPRVMGNSGQLTQLFQNLIGNAIKFRRDEPIHVQVSAVPSDGKWEFSIKDNGIGMEMANAERVFTIFKRLHTKQKYEGTGIGLAGCKKIVEGHGGKIWIESKPAVGTTFKFTLPAEVKMEAAA